MSWKHIKFLLLRALLGGLSLWLVGCDAGGGAASPSPGRAGVTIVITEAERGQTLEDVLMVQRGLVRSKQGREL